MPFKNPFFYSKKAEEKHKKLKELEKRGPLLPPKVNNLKTSKSTFGSSKNTYDLYGTSKKDINFETNKPLAIKPLTDKSPIKNKVEVSEDGYAVNGKIVESVKSTPSEPVEDYPVIRKTIKSKKKRSKK